MLEAFMEKVRSIEGEAQDIPKGRMGDFTIYASLVSAFVLPQANPTEVIFAALLYGYVMSQRDSVNLDDLE